MYVPMGAAVVSTVTSQSAINAIVSSNAAKKKAYEAALAKYMKAVADRTAVIAKNDADQKAYQSALQAYNAKAASIDAANAAMYKDFDAYQAGWQERRTTYDGLLQQRTAILNEQKAQSDAVLKSVTPPPNYGGCITADQRSGYASACDASKVVVKGTDGLGRITRALFGLSGTTAPECIWQTLPICAALPDLPADPGRAPVAPAAQQKPAPPKAPVPKKVPVLPPKPAQPAYQAVPKLALPAPPPMLTPVPVAPPAETPPRSFAVAGLLALVIVGGGAAYYFSTRKKKAA